MKIAKMELYELTARRLNEKGVLPKSCRKFTSSLVQKALAGAVQYPEVIRERDLILKENETAKL
jgi:hypothetical protein